MTTPVDAADEPRHPTLQLPVHRPPSEPPIDHDQPPMAVGPRPYEAAPTTSYPPDAAATPTGGPQHGQLGADSAEHDPWEIGYGHQGFGPSQPAEIGAPQVPGGGSPGLLSRLLADGPTRWVAIAVGSLVALLGLLVVGGIMASGDGQAGVDDAQAPVDGEPADEAAGVIDTDEGDPSATIDTDIDGVFDIDDNCAELFNPDQLNTDGDDQGDACDFDDDNDETDDGTDNCPLVANTGQEDIDADGLGDACDDFTDQDNDGIVDSEDPCIETPDDVDTDGDGSPDQCDETPLGIRMIGASAEITRVAVISDIRGDNPDLFGDMTLDGERTRLRKVDNKREFSPDNWRIGQIEVDEDASELRIRVSIRDESGFCFFCKDRRVDISPVPGFNALHLIVDTETGGVGLADNDWNRLAALGVLDGFDGGDLVGTVTVQGDGGGDLNASLDLSISLIREPRVAG